MRTLRRAILDASGLLGAPGAQQRLFWLARGRRRWREPARLGDIAVSLASDDSLRSARRLDDLSACLRRVLPPAYVGRTRVESLRRGRLFVEVDSAATRYFLRRGLGQELVRALNAALTEKGRDGCRVVERIEYRVGAFASKERRSRSVHLARPAGGK